jgi:hypothetical protein
VDLKAYFHKIRTVEATIPGEDAVVSSLETPDGGKADQFSEVARAVAARLIVQGKARLATQDETEQFKAAAVAALKVSEDASKKDLLQLNIIPQADLELLRDILQKQ